MPAVNSSAILRIWYEPKDKRLFVTFAGGEIYAYEGVPAPLYRAFLAAESKGKFCNAHIRERYPYRRVEHKHRTGWRTTPLRHFGICTSSFTCASVSGAGMNFPATASAMI
jgi:KTSC domain